MSCNGSGLRGTLVNDRAHDGDDTAASARRKADAEKWAALLAAGAARALDNASSLGNAPDGWRGNVEGMTPANAGDPRSNGSTETQKALDARPVAAAGEAESEKLQVRVSIGELGELALVLERSGEGVKIQISAQDRRILETMALEREALTTALSGVGRSIVSLSFVPMDRVGTKLAQTRIASQASKFQRDDGDSAQQTTRRKRRGVNVIG
jgi:hypothetical protein